MPPSSTPAFDVEIQRLPTRDIPPLKHIWAPGTLRKGTTEPALCGHLGKPIRKYAGEADPPGVRRCKVCRALCRERYGV